MPREHTSQLPTVPRKARKPDAPPRATANRSPQPENPQETTQPEERHLESWQRQGSWLLPVCPWAPAWSPTWLSRLLLAALDVDLEGRRAHHGQGGHGPWAKGIFKKCCLENPRRAGIWLLKRTRYHMPKFSAPNTKFYTCDFKIPGMGYCASSTLHQRASSRLRRTPGTQLPGHCLAAPSHLLGNHLSTHSLPPSVIPALQLAVFPAWGP